MVKISLFSRRWLAHRCHCTPGTPRPMRRFQIAPAPLARPPHRSTIQSSRSSCCDNDWHRSIHRPSYGSGHGPRCPWPFWNRCFGGAPSPLESERQLAPSLNGWQRWFLRWLELWCWKESTWCPWRKRGQGGRGKRWAWSYWLLAAWRWHVKKYGFMRLCSVLSKNYYFTMRFQRSEWRFVVPVHHWTVQANMDSARLSHPFLP